MERFDLYDADRVKTGRTMARGEPVPEGFYRLVVHVCVFHPDGRMLIQRRQPFKESWSGLWDVSVGGSAVSGDTSRSAAERETREELGLSLDLSGAIPALTVTWDHGFDDFYLVTLPVNPEELTLQPEEVQTARWAAKDEILEMIDGGRFIPYEKSLIGLLFFRKDHGGCHTRGDWTKPSQAGPAAPEPTKGANTVYCEKCCRLVEETDRCPHCGGRKLREPEPKDPVWLAEQDYLTAGILEDMLTQAGVPFLKKGLMGAGLAVKVGAMLERSRFYVPLERLPEARDVLEALAPQPEENPPA